MKKEYMNPIMQIVEIETEMDILTASKNFLGYEADELGVDEVVDLGSILG